MKIKFLFTYADAKENRSIHGSTLKKTDGIQRVLLDEKGKKVDWEYLNTVGIYILHFKCWQALGTKNKIVICEILSQDTERTVE